MLLFLSFSLHSPPSKNKFKKNKKDEEAKDQKRVEAQDLGTQL